MKDRLPRDAISIRGGVQLPRFAVSTMAFLGAFLSFSMEPIVGRLVTPFFGGAVHVWVVSLMIFQGLLLLGYVYAHRVAPRIGRWHLALLLLPLLQWPLGFTSPIAPEAPVAALVTALLTQISLPFVVLCTTAVVTQWWWHAATSGDTRSEPYFLYATSNLGAMVALFAYPFLVEPFFGVTVQRWAWSIGYLLHAGVAAWTWHLLRPRREGRGTAPRSHAHGSWSMSLRWLVLGAAPSALLLAVTNVIAMEVGSFPMVWVIPLALYLASFIVTFRERQGPVTRRVHFWMIEVALVALVTGKLIGHGVWVLPVVLAAFYVLCVIANEQLYRLRPPPGGLTGYYLAIAVGGFAGGALVSLVAPNVFSSLAEYPLAVLAVVAASWRRDEFDWWKSAPRIKGYLRMTVVVIGGVAFAYSLGSLAVHSARNFYGISRIFDEIRPGATAVPYRMLVHGATLHGMQYLDPQRRHETLSYYYADGALARAVAERDRGGRVAMIGLGAGGALPWFEPGEDVVVFEIDPDMEGLARRWFSYLDDAPAKVTVHVGDARLKLLEEGREAGGTYGLIWVDAFSGDGIPTHLMTLEALDVYLSRLAEDGLLIFHVSNRYYDFRPTLKAAARERGLAAVATRTAGRSADDRLRIDPLVVVLARHPERLAALAAKNNWVAVGAGDGLPDASVWTDDYVNVLAPLWFRWAR